MASLCGCCTVSCYTNSPVHAVGAMVPGLMSFRFAVGWRRTSGEGHGRSRVTPSTSPVCRSLSIVCFRAMAHTAEASQQYSGCQECYTEGVGTCTIIPKVPQASIMLAALAILRAATISRPCIVSYAQGKQTPSLSISISATSKTFLWQDKKSKEGW
jgi:hypothetical protein